MGDSTATTNAKGYVRGKPANIDESHHHVLPLKLYLRVFGALMVLTVLTVAVSFADLGPAALITAMVVASVKAALVVGFFMHLRYDSRFHSFVFFSTLIFVAIFFALTFFDINTRDAMEVEYGNYQRVSDSGELGTVNTTTEDLSGDPEKLAEVRAYLERYGPIISE